MTQLASCDPLAYFHVVEASCRVASNTVAWDSSGNSSSSNRSKAKLIPMNDDGTLSEYISYMFLHSTMLRLPALLAAPDSTQQLLTSWQHYKAYIAAWASWVKAWVKLLVEGCAGRDEDFLSDTLLLMNDALGWLLVDVNQLHTPDTERTTRFSPVMRAGNEVPLTLAGIQLVLLLWVARCIAAAKRMLPAAGRAGAEGSSSSGGRSSNGGSSSSSGGTVWARRQQQPADPLTVGLPPPNALAAAGVMYWCCLFLWQEAARECFSDDRVGFIFEIDSAGNARVLSTYTNAAGAKAAAAAALGTEHAAAGSSDMTRNTDSGTAAAASAEEQLSKRLMLLPRECLTPAVRTQMTAVSRLTSFPYGVAQVDEIGVFVGGLSEAQLGDLLVEVVKLSELMLAEVPCTMGCSNPLCTNLSGVSEMEVKAGSRKTVLKACTACNVVWYCSRECQVGHWKVHQPLCKRLQQQQKEKEQEGQQVEDE